jgi:hypothetical protein
MGEKDVQSLLENVIDPLGCYQWYYIGWVVDYLLLKLKRAKKKPQQS